MNQTSASAQINILLEGMNSDGGFPISVLCDLHGFTIAWAATKGLDPERQSAVVAFMQKSVLQVGKQLGMGVADEISFYDAAGQHLVCRPFNVNDYGLILAVMVPGRDLSYRRATNSAINKIQKIWEKYWK